MRSKQSSLARQAARLDTGRRKAFDERVAELEAFLTLHGHYPERYGGKALASAERSLAGWVGHVRQRKRKGKLTSHQIECLEAIGFVWNMAHSLQFDRLAILAVYVLRYGHLRVSMEGGETVGEMVHWYETLGRHQAPRKPVEKTLLNRVGEIRLRSNEYVRSIIAHLRAYKRSGALAASLVNQLDAMGMCWNVYDADFEASADAWKQFQSRSLLSEDSQIESLKWARQVKQRLRMGELRHREGRLQELGLHEDLDLRIDANRRRADVAWVAQLESLCQQVAVLKEQNLPLIRSQLTITTQNWLEKQFSRWRRHKLDDGRRSILERVDGFPWSQDHRVAQTVLVKHSRYRSAHLDRERTQGVA